MGLFDIFRKKKTEEPVEQSIIADVANITLEGLLQLAATDSMYRPAMYQRLLDDNLVVITSKRENLPQGEYVAQERAQVSIVALPTGHLPIFTNQQRIFDQKIITEAVQTLTLKGKDLFITAKGAKFVLNPYSATSKELLPDEIAAMLAGSIITGRSRNIILDRPMMAQIGQPSIYPTELVSGLIKLFGTMQHVKAAYFGWILIEEMGDPPHYIFGIDADSYTEKDIAAIGAVITEVYPNKIVDVVNVNEPNSTGTDYLKTTEPFYKR